MSQSHQKLREVVQRVFDKHSDSITISPSTLANEAMHYLDPDQKADPVIALAANLQFRQVARGLCRGLEVAEEAQTAMDFHKALQTRYPTARSANNVEPEYILLDHMTDEDFAFNIQRLEREADAKTAHARALKAFWQFKGSAIAA